MNDDDTVLYEVSNQSSIKMIQLSLSKSPSRNSNKALPCSSKRFGVPGTRSIPINIFPLVYIGVNIRLKIADVITFDDIRVAYTNHLLVLALQFQYSIHRISQQLWIQSSLDLVGNGFHGTERLPSSLFKC